MFGAIIGDIAGSRFEGKYDIPDDFELIAENSKFTDDTVHTIAIAEALRLHFTEQTPLYRAATEQLQTLGRRYLWCGCGDRFYEWLFMTEPKSYNSFGNGAAMRVSPCAYFGSRLEQVMEYARIVTEITHNHPDGVKGAQATASAVFFARCGESKDKIKQKLERFGLSFGKPENTGKFQIACLEAVSLALSVFFNTSSFEDCIRQSVLLGGDTDTIAAIAGSVAWAYYGKTVSDPLAVQAISKLDDYLREILSRSFDISSSDGKD